MSESCNSRHFSWLTKTCFPNSKSLSSSTCNPIPIPIPISSNFTLSSLPDDLLLECLTRVPSSSLPSLSLVCRRWSHLLLSPSFHSLRRLHNLINPTVFAFSTSSSVAISLRFHQNNRISLSLSQIPSFTDNISHSRLSSIGSNIYIITPSGFLFSYHTWTSAISLRSSITFPRKKFAAAAVSGKIYVAGGSSTAASAVEEYDPETDSWTVVAQSPRKRFGCTGAAVDGVFYVIGGLKIAGGDGAAHVYASSMDLYDVEARVWLRSRALPGGGCVVAACSSAAGFVYILASHAVELSFWRFDARRRKYSNGGGCSFGEWCRIKSPPLPAQVRLDSTVRFSCVGVEDKVVLIQVAGCIDDVLRRSGRNVRGFKEGLVLVYDSGRGDWSRGPDLPEVIRRAACVAVEC